MVESKLRYEECRRQRLEENKKRMKELNLSNLAQALKTSSPKSSPVRQVKPRSRLPLEPSTVPPRRSSRVADKPPPCYKEVLVEPLGRPRSYQRRDLLNRRYASDKARKYAIERAGEVQSGLESNLPSFVKPMLQSHVTGGFWLGLPVQFCKKHLPHEDEIMSLVDEEGNEFPTKYLAEKTGLSGGWRGFSVDHQLVDGDAVVFHLVRPTEFKVYIIRAHDMKNDEESEEKEEDLDVTPLRRSAKRTRASNSVPLINFFKAVSS
ncbi:hypothetical protein FNV43_RR22478 [Rhamnella rubrinervis]|uniref:TF-B3 domain-containing protein n=1 Tax=Rhamnella rubrinervis TaxID=2594499 RepID=A0A8K0DW92_9ROSA|nr:hypothetical protein FNV43_RR22478 [Rhamnella rubrinervis]